MVEEYKVVYEGGEGEIIEKKSRFIATVVPVDTEEEALTFIEAQKKKYWDARHNCSAYVIGSKNEIIRCSDDGEPSGTAGKPMLEILVKEEIHNALVVVTRYFGGVLLGTGGLIRAYQKATKEGLNKSIIINKSLGYQLEVNTDYNGIGKIQYIIGQMNITTVDTDYTDEVTIHLLLPPRDLDCFQKKVIEATNGKAKMLLKDQVYYANILGETVIF
ncbi:YigZ family protein [Anaeromicropila herbilytica]|uniref:YigZ family protein n=1 Tax=Anaeromicropila herbilytica TaxID=2785025 RepID=A0A7R7EJ03_9FIRM|nr:YigZ family protein [Anaeromicropila herbilytica]BCN30040.1 YigZ family protein [Anaeromicropila herbilytica]